MDTNNRCKTGFIGYGSMGRIPAEGLLRTGALSPDQTLVSTRDITRCRTLIQNNFEVLIADDNHDLAYKLLRIILCV
jgi:pyrroline-5-carboxylate reductase